ncbi:hypothetical protein F4781DRAFT_343024 [Annulohypoxylon bovei var. microspora]|nr:hypothetical protein F4781DRAFT_343024 [Annulohypoxylon bovei var. microspora]
MPDFLPSPKSGKDEWTPAESGRLSIRRREPGIRSGLLHDEFEKRIPTPCSNCLGFPFKVEGSMGWAGNQPCVYGPSEGCSRHNPEGLPIAWNKRIPSDKKKPGIIERLRGPSKASEYDEVQRSTRIWSSLHLDNATADPLDPIHASIRYALAYYHLNWVRTAESPDMQQARVNSLACNGTVLGDGKRRPDYQFWNNPYWHNGSFLVQQAIRFTIPPKKRNPLLGKETVYLDWPRDDWTFYPCPHIQHRFGKYQFLETRGLMKAKVGYTTKKYSVVIELETKSNTDWESINGPLCHASNCQHCCTDNWMHINLIEDKIVVHMYVWKDLGNALNAYDKKWIAALRPDGPRWRRSKDEANSNVIRTTVLAAVNASKGVQSSSQSS